MTFEFNAPCHKPDCVMYISCVPKEKKVTSTIEDIVKVPQLLFRNTNSLLSFLEVYITALS